MPVFALDACVTFQCQAMDTASTRSGRGVARLMPPAPDLSAIKAREATLRH